jgi:hypothetical protein
MVLEPVVVRPVLRFADAVIVEPVGNQDVVAAFAFDGERGVYSPRRSGKRQSPCGRVRCLGVEAC